MRNKYVRAYHEFMVDAAAIFGANKANVESELLATLQFEMELAEVLT